MAVLSWREQMSLNYPPLDDEHKAFLEKINQAAEGLHLRDVTKMEEMFDEIIAIDVDEDIQIKRLMERNPDTGKFLKQLNDKNVSFEKNKKRANIIIKNNGSIDDLIVNTKKVINKLLDRLD